MRYPLPVLAGLACAVAACAPPPLTPADEEAVRAVDQAYVVAANASNVEALTALYTSDAVVQPPGMRAASGTAAIHKLYVDMTTPMRVRLTTSGTRVSGQGDLAYVTGTYHAVYTMKDGTQTAPPAEDGKFLDVRMRQPDKSWKIVASSWNQNSMPAPAAPPARPTRRH